MTRASDDNQVYLNDLSKIRNSLFRFANKMLIEHGEFYPSARIVKLDGAIAVMSASTGEERPSPTKHYEFLRRGVIAAAGQNTIRAAGLCANVNGHEGKLSSAIRMLIEHAEGGGVEVLIPYVIKAPGSIEFQPDECRPMLPELFARRNVA
jgi:hypothetical protein